MLALTLLPAHLLGFTPLAGTRAALPAAAQRRPPTLHMFEGSDTTATQQVTCEPGWQKTEGGLKFQDVSCGTGAVPGPNDIVSIHYTITYAESGQVLGSSHERWPLTFALGKQHVPVFEDALDRMTVGSTRKVVIPASRIPSVQSDNVPKDQEGESLVAEIELLRVEQGISAIVPSLLPPGSRRIVILRTLFLLSFIPYFFPDDIKPDAFKFGDPVAIQQAHEAAKNSLWLGGAATSLDSLF